MDEANEEVIEAENWETSSSDSSSNSRTQGTQAKSKSGSLTGQNDPFPTSRKNLRRVTHCDAWNHRIDATKTASLSNFQIRLRDCTDQLSRRFSDGDLRSSPDLKGDSPRRRKFNTSCQFCDGCTRKRTVPDVDTDKLSVQINPLKSDTPQVLAESYNELDTPQVSAESYNELDTPQVSAESYKELDTPQVLAESYNKPDHNSELTNRLKVIALEETMARSRDPIFDDTPDHLYGLDHPDDFSSAEDADISIGKPSPCKELTGQNFKVFAVGMKMFYVPLCAMLLACLLALMLTLQGPVDNAVEDTIIQQERQETDVSLELREIKEKLNMLSSRFGKFPDNTIDTVGEIAVRKTCDADKGPTSKEISRVLEDMVKDKVEEAIDTFTADRIGIPDYALASYGGRIHTGYHSPSYEHIAEEVKYLGWHVWNRVRSPRVVIQMDNSPGNCWPFEGQEGFLVIELSLRIRPTAFTLEHISPSLSPRGDGRIPSAPKDFSVWGWREPSGSTRDLLGTYSYDIRGKPLQTFQVQDDHSRLSYQYVELRVHSNHGEPLYTCIYRFRVHGKPVEELPLTTQNAS